jgi:hypothetical protein
MNMDEVELADLALDAFKSSTGVVAELLPGRLFWTDHVEDKGFAVILGQALVIEVRRNVDRTIAVERVWQHLNVVREEVQCEGGLLVANHLTPKILEQCRARGLNAIDVSGNAFVAIEGLYVFVSGRRQQVVRERLGWSGAAVRLGLIALVAPNELGGTQRSLAAKAGVALGSVRPALDWLAERGFVRKADWGPVERHRDEFLTEWESAYSARVKPKLNSSRYSPESGSDRSWWETFDPTPARWSGDVAAQQMVGYLKPAMFSMFVAPAERASFRRRIVRDLELRADVNGSIEIIDRFWADSLSDDHLAPWPIVYADLLATNDNRAIETADLIRKKYLHA